MKADRLLCCLKQTEIGERETRCKEGWALSLSYQCGAENVMMKNIQNTLRISIPCAGRMHFQRRHSVVPGTLEKPVNGIMMERSTSDQLLQKRQTVKAYRALENNNPLSDSMDPIGESLQALARLNCTRYCRYNGTSDTLAAGPTHGVREPTHLLLSQGTA